MGSSQSAFQARGATPNVLGSSGVGAPQAAGVALEVADGDHLARTPVVKIASAVLAHDAAFLHRATLCLAQILDQRWTPEVVELSEGCSLPEWVDLPQDGGFIIARVGARNRCGRVTESNKLEQVRAYAKHLPWAEAACGLSQEEFRQCLTSAAAVQQISRGTDGIPTWMRRIKITVREHAALLCRIAGLRKAAAAEVAAELGAAFAANAVTELERIMALAAAEVQLECEAVHWTLQGQQGFDLRLRGSSKNYNSGAWVLGLFRVWLRGEGAALMGMRGAWRDLTRVVPTCEVDAPGVFSLDAVEASRVLS